MVFACPVRTDIIPPGNAEEIVDSPGDLLVVVWRAGRTEQEERLHELVVSMAGILHGRSPEALGENVVLEQMVNHADPGTVERRAQDVEHGVLLRHLEADLFPLSWAGAQVVEKRDCTGEVIGGEGVPEGLQVLTELFVALLEARAYVPLSVFPTAGDWSVGWPGEHWVGKAVLTTL